MKNQVMKDALKKRMNGLNVTISVEPSEEEDKDMLAPPMSESMDTKDVEGDMDDMAQGEEVEYDPEMAIAEGLAEGPEYETTRPPSIKDKVRMIAKKKLESKKK